MVNRTEKQQNTEHTDHTMNPSSLYYLQPTDTGLKIVLNVFSGTGYKGWKRVVTIALSEKNKLGFVNGTIKRAIHNQELAKA